MFDGHGVWAEVEGVTYRDLEAALTALGFVKRTTDASVVFALQKAGVEVVLPRIPQEKPLRRLHLLAARKSVVDGGVAEEAEFDALFDTAVGSDIANAPARPAEAHPAR